GVDARMHGDLRRAVRHRFMAVRQCGDRQLLDRRPHDCHRRADSTGTQDLAGKPLTSDAGTAVSLGRGLGSRMRRDDTAATLDPRQAQVASAGLKTMIPDASGRPFIEHIISSLADAGVRSVILVVAPDADPIRTHFEANPTSRVQLEYAIQQEAIGTANALLAAEPLLGDQDFLVLNADNLYPVAAIRAVVTLGEPGLVAFGRDGLVELGNSDRDRVAAFAILRVNARGLLEELVEKPDAVSLQLSDTGL